MVRQREVERNDHGIRTSARPQDTRGMVPLMKRMSPWPSLWPLWVSSSNWRSSRSTSVRPLPIGGRSNQSGRRWRRSEARSRVELTAKYATEQPAIRDLVARVADRYGRTAQAIDRTDGLQGLVSSTVSISRRSSFTKSIPPNSTGFEISLGAMQPPISCCTGVSISD